MEFLNNHLNKNSFMTTFPEKAIILAPEDSLIRNLKRVVLAKPVYSLFFRLRLIINLLISFLLLLTSYLSLSSLLFSGRLS